MGYAITLKEITDATVNDSQDWVDSGFQGQVKIIPNKSQDGR